MKRSFFFHVNRLFYFPKVHWILVHFTLISTLCDGQSVSNDLIRHVANVTNSSFTSVPSVLLTTEESIVESSDQLALRTFPQLNIQASNGFEVDPLIIPYVVLADTLEEQRQRAHSLRETVAKRQRFRETLDAYTVTDLPIGISRSGGETLNYCIVIDRINFSTKGSELMAFMSFVIPDNGKAIAFGGKIPLSKDGGIVGTSRIYLLGDHTVTIGSVLVTLKGSLGNKTFVEVDCNGFKGMSIEAELEFSRDQLVPEDERGERIEDKRVKVNFQTYIQEWNELLVKISIPPFQIKGLDGVGFKVEDAYLDWSDLSNPIGLAFPKDYQSSFISSGNSNLWKGFFIRKAELRLPNKFQEKRNGDRIKLGVENLIIDDTGFSGKASAENLIQNGDMNGWAYTMDQVKVGFVSNQLQQFQLAGTISVPVLKQDDKPSRMGYLASRGLDGSYIFAVTVLNRVKLPLWAADVTLYNGSGISIKEKENKFYPTATLNGMLSIGALNKGPKAELAGIHFEQLIISSEAPYFKGGTFGFGTDTEGSKVSGFPLIIKGVGIKSNSTNSLIGLSLNVTINIGGDPSKEGFAGTADLIVWGVMNESNSVSIEKESSSSNNRWQFDQVELSAVAVSIKKPNVYDLTGSVRFFENDPMYGDGFRGQFVGRLQKIDAMTTGLFGKTDSFRYWYADALVNVKGGVAIAPGLAAYAFGGGFYSRMKQNTSIGNAFNPTPSGINYVPDEKSIGLRAFVGFGGTPTREAFNGEVTLEVAMNQSGGINNITMVGNAFLLTPSLSITDEIIKEGASQVANKAKRTVNYLMPKSQVYGSVNLNFDNVNNVFHGNLEVYVNAAGGLIKGVGEGNKAGWATLHFANDEWYVLIGTPAQPIGLEMARLFRTQSYFMMGMNLPNSSPPPQELQEMLNAKTVESMRDFGALQSGTGFAFGLNFGVDTGDLQFLMFYGRFNAGAGFDIMLKNYGTGYHCEGASGPVGVNGWFANGQAYAYVEGKIGIKVNLKFYKGDYDILKIGAAALMQVKGPNPFWMKGTVGGDYRILGGLVKGNCKFEVTVGKDCKPVGESNALGDVSIIAEVSPAKGSRDVDVFNTPQAAFNVPIGEIFNITDIEGNTRIFRVKLSEFSIKDGSAIIPATVRWNASNDVGIIDSKDILPGKKELKVVVRVQFEEKKGGEWQSVQFEGKTVEELVETNFITGEAPDFIPPSNVEISYPIIGQYNFHPREYDAGFIKLRKGQPDLFQQGKEWIQKARVSSVNEPQNYKEFDFSYDNGTTTVNFSIPSNLPLNTIQKFELLNIPLQDKVIDANVQRITTELVNDNQGTAQLTTKDIEGKLDLLEVKSIYESGFRTSRFGTFKEKINSIGIGPAVKINLDVNVFQLASRLSGSELFDETEIIGRNGSKLIRIEALLTDNSWYQNYVYPLVYEGYPLLGFAVLRHRQNPEKLGIPPIRDIYFQQDDIELKIFNGVPSSEPRLAFTNGSIRYNLMSSMVVDYNDLQNRIANYVVDRPYLLTPRLSGLILNTFPWLRYGPYKMSIQYIIPGTDISTTSFHWEMFNTIRDN